MKRLLLSALLVLPPGLSSATAPETPAPIHATEHRAVMAASAKRLAASLDLRPDGSARTTHQIGKFSTRIEFQQLAIREIVKLPVSEHDQQRGVTRRYQAKLSCVAHRLWESSAVAWSAWRGDAYGFFPSSLIVEEIAGQMRVNTPRLKQFSPGIDGAITNRASTR